MLKSPPLEPALIAALLGSVALVGCKKKEESTDSNAAPAATAPAEPAAPAPMTGAPPPMAEAAAVSVSTVTVGKTAAADKSVAPAALTARWPANRPRP
ncbi:hypothetical protein G6F68_019413 [Rhizopus microsporus]|nr:hypothetical protein G6F68_019413 [Rhizopus microsporus]